MLSGITPACAGKTALITSTIIIRWDHPRVCGKNVVFSTAQASSVGSPPRVREKRNHAAISLRAYGITPACAGKTNRIPEYLRFLRDHPRVCGKNACARTHTLIPLGSPPRVREKPPVHGRLFLFCGITPACAGKTIVLSVLLRLIGDHPRVCGKNS